MSSCCFWKTICVLKLEQEQEQFCTYPTCLKAQEIYSSVDYLIISAWKKTWFYMNLEDTLSYICWKHFYLLKNYPFRFNWFLNAKTNQCRICFEIIFCASMKYLQAAKYIFKGHKDQTKSVLQCNSFDAKTFHIGIEESICWKSNVPNWQGFAR